MSFHIFEIIVLVIHELHPSLTLDDLLERRAGKLQP
jgi:hypothetical protein